MTKELRISYTDIEKAFLLKHPLGSIKKINGGINVVFNLNKDNKYGYNYRGTNKEISDKLNLNIKEYNASIQEKELIKTGIIEVELIIDLDLLNLNIQGEKVGTFKCIINSGHILIRDKELKLYKSKKGIYFILKGKRQYINIDQNIEL